jgi:predicted transcriptional regulator
LDGSFFIRQGEQPIDEDSKNISRELKRLEQMGIVQSEKRSNLRCNQVNKKCPFLES